MNYCPINSEHKNWYGALFCGHCGVRTRERIVRCKNCGHDVIGGNDVISGWGVEYCTLCGSQDFEIIDRMAEGRSDLLPEHIRKDIVAG